MFKSTPKSSVGLLFLGIAVAATSSMVSAVAAPPVTGLDADARLLSDDELGDLRGRFAPEQLNFVGIQMVSMWQTGDGNLLTASLVFEASLYDPNPDDAIAEREFDPDAKLLAGWTDINVCADECDPDLNIDNHEIPAGLNSVTGAVQSITISGDSNDASNLMTVHVGDYGAESVGQAVLGPNIFNLNMELEDLTIDDFPDGFVVTFSKSNNSLGMILQGPGPSQQADGLAVQGVNVGGSNQFAQHIQLMGSDNLIHNSLSLYVGIDQSPATQAAVENALSVMKGWGF